MTSELVQRAQAWAAGDCDEDSRRQTLNLIEEADEKKLLEYFSGSLRFGTAGIRAVVGPGPQRMNRAVVRRTTKAVAQYLLKHHPDGRSLPVVVAFDGRLSSRMFAEEAIGVLVASGIDVRYFEEPTATPLAAYALRRYAGLAAVVITASHNPARYNGYKLYASNGAQIISPADEQIARLIEQMPAANQIACKSGVLSGSSERAEPVGEEVIDGYFRDIDAVRPRHGRCRDLKIVYTAMHGVGYQPVRRALLHAGFSGLIPVDEQVQPDGNFPTVPFPNPEEEGALDLALAKAEAVNADLILANDPDADRLAVCVKTVATEGDFSGQYKLLTGNQIGLALADYMLANYNHTDTPLVVQSIVSSPMLEAIAKHYGAHCERTLTGFKWLWNAALSLREQKRYRFVFGFEEALGYSVEDIVRDKDGVSAALLFAELAAEEKANGSSVLQRLARMYREHGLWVSHQYSVTNAGSEGSEQMAAAIERIAQNPPEQIAGIAVAGLKDFRTGGEHRPYWLENSPLLEFNLGESGRVLVRPSGTEPKLKIYVDLRQPVNDSANVWQAETTALQLARKIAVELVADMGLQESSARS